MKFKRNLCILISIILVVGAIFIGLISTSTKSPSTSAQTIVLAEGAGANPNYIFPYMGSQFFSIDNINQIQSEMFRLLYRFGLAGSVAVVPSLSLATQPLFTNDT